MSVWLWVRGQPGQANGLWLVMRARLIFFLLANVGALLGVWGIMSLFVCPFWWCRHVVCVWWLLLGWGGV